MLSIPESISTHREPFFVIYMHIHIIVEGWRVLLPALDICPIWTLEPCRRNLEQFPAGWVSRRYCISSPIWSQSNMGEGLSGRTFWIASPFVGWFRQWYRGRKLLLGIFNVYGDRILIDEFLREIPLPFLTTSSAWFRMRYLTFIDCLSQLSIWFHARSFRLGRNKSNVVTVQ